MKTRLTITLASITVLAITVVAISQWTLPGRINGRINTLIAGDQVNSYSHRG